MARKSPKTRVICVVQGYYGGQYGWEDVTAETDPKECKARLKEYRENERAPFRMIRRRERKTGR